MKFYWDTFKIGPWGVYSFAPPDVRESMVHGKPADFSYLVAVTDFRAGVQMELMQPVKEARLGSVPAAQFVDAFDHRPGFQPRADDAVEEIGRLQRQQLLSQVGRFVCETEVAERSKQSFMCRGKPGVGMMGAPTQLSRDLVVAASELIEEWDRLP